MTVPVRFDDGAGYQQYMGVWSQCVAHEFLDWLAPAAGLAWLDVGCGNGAFTQVVLDRCAPVAATGIDPSPAQLAFAMEHVGRHGATLLRGDAQALPFMHDAFDVAVMPLVLFFLSAPARGIQEMVRVTRPGGSVSAYVWDMAGQGFPYAPVALLLRDLGIAPPGPPHPEVASLDALQGLWREGGLADVGTTVIPVDRTFASFDEYWATIHLAPSTGQLLSTLDARQRAALRSGLIERLGADGGPLTLRARAHAVRGRVPGR